MDVLIIYSSVTGNTEKIANAIAEKCKELKHSTTLISSEEFAKKQNLLHNFDLIGIGFWVDKGTVDRKSIEVIKKLKNKNIFLFATSGARPETKHIEKVKEKVLKLSSGNKIKGLFISQGAIAQYLIERRKEKMKNSGFSNLELENYIAKTKESQKHPTQNDIQNCKKFAEKMCNLIGN